MNRQKEQLLDCQHHQPEREPRTQAELALAGIETFPEPIFFTNMGGVVSYANRAAVSRARVPAPEGLVGYELQTLLPASATAEEIIQEVITDGYCQKELGYFDEESGKQAWTLLTSSLIMKEEGHPLGIITLIQDITERKKAEFTDSLTGLNDRRGFEVLAEQQLRIADREQRSMWLFFFDLDGLKRINDAFGHPEGDRALREAADIFRETFRESDIIARIGGDEFVALAVETGEDGAETLIGRLQEKLDTHNARGDRRYDLSLSVGLARYNPENPCSLDELTARADRKMYERKREQ